MGDLLKDGAYHMTPAELEKALRQGPHSRTPEEIARDRGPGGSEDTMEMSPAATARRLAGLPAGIPNLGGSADSPRQPMPYRPSATIQPNSGDALADWFRDRMTVKDGVVQQGPSYGSGDTPKRVQVRGPGTGVSYDEAMKAADQLPFRVTWIEQVGPDRWIPKGSDDETGGGAGSPGPDAPPPIPDWLQQYMKSGGK